MEVVSETLSLLQFVHAVGVLATSLFTNCNSLLRTWNPFDQPGTAKRATRSGPAAVTSRFQHTKKTVDPVGIWDGPCAHAQHAKDHFGAKAKVPAPVQPVRYTRRIVAHNARSIVQKSPEVNLTV